MRTLCVEARPVVTDVHSVQSQDKSTGPRSAIFVEPRVGYPSHSATLLLNSNTEKPQNLILSISSSVILSAVRSYSHLVCEDS